MRITIRNIIAILLIVIGGLSCSRALVDNMDVSNKGSHRIVLSGIVVDTETSEPLEDIKITFSVYGKDSPSQPILVKNVYTDDKGIYNINIETLSKKIRCTLCAESSDAEYLSASQDINILWSGTSYDQNSGTFFVNDCNFQLSRTESDETTY